MVCSLPRSSVHGDFQGRILEWVAISFSKGSSRSRDQTLVSCKSSALQEGSLPLSHLGSQIWSYCPPPESNPALLEPQRPLVAGPMFSEHKVSLAWWDGQPYLARSDEGASPQECCRG